MLFNACKSHLQTSAHGYEQYHWKETNVPLFDSLKIPISISISFSSSFLFPLSTFFFRVISCSTTTINMLHVQESFINSNLLMTSPMTVIVQPQPSSSSRSNKVIEQLSNKYELIQKDLAATRAQVCYKSLIFITSNNFSSSKLCVKLN